ncbi:MAG: hypothetical protein IJB96_04225 [Lachnospira sp.]|nr:hypothetical protein [Lachnospira sp.]
MKKFYVCVIIGCLLVIAFVVYRSEMDARKNLEPESWNTETQFNFNRLEGYAVEDDRSLDELLTVEYGIEELREFFGGRNSNEVSNEDEYPLTYTEVNKRFPVEVIRSRNYSVYKVIEGGYFYVFWQRGFDSKAGKYVGDLHVYFSGYINGTQNQNLLYSINVDETTIADVRKLDPDVNFTFLETPIRSCSYLDKEHLLEIKYWYKYNRCDADNETYEKGVKDENNFFVDSVEIVPREEALSNYSSIMEKDLP